MMKVIAAKAFQFDGHEISEGQALDLPTAEAKMLIARGRAREEHPIEEAAQALPAAKARRAKRVYGTRDMVAEGPSGRDGPVDHEGVETPPAAPADEPEIKGGE